MNKILILLGKTCTGKTTVGNVLSKKYGYKKCVTYTTRPIRPSEVEGVDYHFVDEETFKKMLSDGKFAEYAEYDATFGHCYYGSTKESYQNLGDEKRYIILNPYGFRMVKDAGVENYSILLHASDKVIKDRLCSRGDKEDEAVRRMAADSRDFADIRPDTYIGVDGVTPEAIAKTIDKLVR